MKLAVISEIDALITILQHAANLNTTGNQALADAIVTLQQGFDTLNADYRAAILALHSGLDNHITGTLRNAYLNVKAAVASQLNIQLSQGDPVTFYYSYSYSASISIPPPVWRNPAGEVPMTITMP